MQKKDGQGWLKAKINLSLGRVMALKCDYPL